MHDPEAGEPSEPGHRGKAGPAKVERAIGDSHQQEAVGAKRLTGLTQEQKWIGGLIEDVDDAHHVIAGSVRRRRHGITQRDIVVLSRPCSVLDRKLRTLRPPPAIQRHANEEPAARAEVEQSPSPGIAKAGQ